MADTTAFELVSPERLLAAKDVAMVIVPGAEGNIGVLPRHAPLITTVRPGVIEVFENRAGEGERIFVAGGFAEVTPERCTILAEEATPVVDIDRAQAEQALKNVREDLEDAKTDAERADLEVKVKIAEARVEAL